MLAHESRNPLAAIANAVNLASKFQAQEQIEWSLDVIKAFSEGLGKGSEFTIRLPASKEPQRPTSKGKTTRPAAKKAVILVVDDNVDTARGMARYLRLVGHEVLTAHSGLDALEAAKQHSPEFILLDIGLLGMSGYEVTTQLRKEEYGKGAVIIAISGYGQDEDRRQAKSAGFDYHLTKPLDPDRLLNLLSARQNGEPTTLTR